MDLRFGLDTTLFFVYNTSMRPLGKRPILDYNDVALLHGLVEEDIKREKKRKKSDLLIWLIELEKKMNQWCGMHK